MTARELYNAYMRGHKMVQLEGKENHDLLMLPVLLGCVRDIYYKHLRKAARTSTQTKLGKGIREIMTSLIGREYWGMSADEIDSFCTYMDAMTSELQYQIFGLQRAMYNYYEDYEDKRREIMSWSMTAHSIAYTMARLREKMFVAVNKEDVEFDRQRQQSKYDRL